jgi:alginate O-acetyltransferase complex protein AlgI
MFPQLIAGPIVRYPDIEKQLKERTLSWQKFGQGAAWFIRGLGKKVLLANNIGPVFDAISALPASDRSVLTSWVGAIAYAMQIYFDFSGYSDMAVGLGKMFGFEFVRNFNYPYTSDSITEFWRRWHISLSTWFREYVYIPLGGNRVSVPRHICNLMIVWMLTGLWHGASWNFVFWGAYYGVLLILEKYLFHNVLDRLPRLVQKLITFVLVLIGWVFFFSPTLTEAFSYLGTMFGIHANGFLDKTALYYLQGSLLLLLICIVGCTRYPCLLARRWLSAPGKISFIRVWIFYLGVLIFSVAYLVNATYNPFLYFRF